MFAEQIKERVTGEAYALLKQLGIGDFGEMYGLLLQFPSIIQPGIDLARLSNLAFTQVSPAIAGQINSAANSAPPAFSTGALSPPKSRISVNSQQPQSPQMPSSVISPSVAPITHRMGSPVRDQGTRGTCVAHATIACAEHHFTHSDLSEQFVFWAIKTHGGDPSPHLDGTRLEFADRALLSHGACEELHWSYNPTPIPGNVTQETPPHLPSSVAIQDGQTRAKKPSHYSDTSPQGSGSTALLIRELQKGPVAVSLPVFRDPTSKFQNWNWQGARDHGHVIDPPPNSIVIGGHAVCVCEFQPSPNAPGNGWFVFKNSWGTAQWGSGNQLAPPGHPPCPKGYGYVSASYIDGFLWEMLRL